MSGLKLVHYNSSSDEDDETPNSSPKMVEREADVDSENSADEPMNGVEEPGAGSTVNSNASSSSEKAAVKKLVEGVSDTSFNDDKDNENVENQSKMEHDGTDDAPKSDLAVKDVKTEEVRSTKREPQIRFNVDIAVKYTRKLQKMEIEDFEMPQPPEQKCSDDLIANVKRKMILKEQKGRSFDPNHMIQKRKDFRNPSIYDKLIQLCKINERGTNYPKECYDPEYWYRQPTYEDLARAQREKYSQQKKTKVEHVTGTAKKSSSRPGSAEPAKKTKWDKTSSDSMLKQAQSNTAAKYPFPVVKTTSSSSSKTSIPATGQLTKDKTSSVPKVV